MIFVFFFRERKGEGKQQGYVERGVERERKRERDINVNGNFLYML